MEELLSIKLSFISGKIGLRFLYIPLNIQIIKDFISLVELLGTVMKTFYFSWP